MNFPSVGTCECTMCGEQRECFDIDGAGNECARCYADALGHGYEVDESNADDLFVEGFGREMNTEERATFNTYAR